MFSCQKKKAQQEVKVRDGQQKNKIAKKRGHEKKERNNFLLAESLTHI